MPSSDLSNTLGLVVLSLLVAHQLYVSTSVQSQQVCRRPLHPCSCGVVLGNRYTLCVHH